MSWQARRREKSYAKRYALQMSDDKLTWTDIYQTSTGKGGTEDLTNLNGRGRSIPLNATERVTRYGYSLYEFEVFGPDQPGN